MELPQPRPFETEGRKPTHDFLSLCSHSTVPQDPRPPSSQGGYLKTQDFLQPLERVGKASGAKGESGGIEISDSERPPPPAAPPPPSVDQHVLPGGIGTYTISHIPYFNQRVPKPEVSPMFTVAEASSSERNTDENSNCSSYAVSGFTLWEEGSGKKGQTRKENVGERTNTRDAATKLGQWPVAERPSQSSSSNHRSSLNSRSSSQGSGLKSQSFMDMIRSAKGSSQDDDLDDDEEFIIKKESPSSSQRMDLRVKVDGKSPGNDQKPNTPRSKHSATEQRRRSKINDRFQMLRQLIPNSDQKRDKASFLLEVIEYIQFLHEKVNTYEGPYQRWNPEPGKLMTWRNNQQPAEGSGVAPSIILGPKFEEKNSIPISQRPIANAQSQVMDHRIDQQQQKQQQQQRPGATVPFPLSLQSNNFFSPILTGNPVSQFPVGTPSEAANPSPTSQTQSQSCPFPNNFAADSDKLKEQEQLAVDGGTISISSVYSQGLLKTLTQALQSSGVDLSKASISVQIQLGKQRSLPSLTLQDGEVHRTTRRRPDDGDDNGSYDQNPKRLKTNRN